MKSQVLKRCIIAGFPGIGKSIAASKYPNLFLDMESSDYHWIIDDDGNKSCNPEWPINYVNKIISIASTPITNKHAHVYICISTHKEVLDELRNRDVYYIAVVPKTKDIYIQRYKDRGNSEEFIKKLDENFYNFVEDVKKSSALLLFSIDCYLADIFANTN